jgi:hypothetical protein
MTTKRPCRGKRGHTIEHRGARVVVTLTDGTWFTDVFVERAKNNRWIVVKERGRIPIAKLASVSRIGKRTLAAPVCEGGTDVDETLAVATTESATVSCDVAREDLGGNAESESHPGLPVGTHRQAD